MRCKYEDIRGWPACFEDGDLAGTNTRPNHQKKTGAQQPTQEQIREFWEWCGIPETYIFINKPFSDMIPVDFNNLFKYAVPKVLEKIGKEELVVLVNNSIFAAVDSKGEIALALFWAIFSLIEKSPPI